MLEVSLSSKHLFAALLLLDTSFHLLCFHPELNLGPITTAKLYLETAVCFVPSTRKLGHRTKGRNRLDLNGVEKAWHHLAGPHSYLCHYRGPLLLSMGAAFARHISKTRRMLINCCVSMRPWAGFLLLLRGAFDLLIFWQFKFFLLNIVLPIRNQLPVQHILVKRLFSKHSRPHCSLTDLYCNYGSLESSLRSGKWWLRRWWCLVTCLVKYSGIIRSTLSTEILQNT